VSPENLFAFDFEEGILSNCLEEDCIMQNQSVKTNSSMRVDLKRETLPAQISKHLLQHITDQNMKPGDLLPSATNLATEFGVSHPVIREALQSLSALGVITVLKGKGAIIKSVDDESLRIFFQRVQQTEANPIVSLMEVRIPLEIQSATLAAQRHTHEDIWTLENIITEMSQSLENASRTIALDTEFHLAISQATHNRILLYLINSTRNA